MNAKEEDGVDWTRICKGLMSAEEIEANVYGQARTWSTRQISAFEGLADMCGSEDGMPVWVDTGMCGDDRRKARWTRRSVDGNERRLKGLCAHRPCTLNLFASLRIHPLCANLTTCRFHITLSPPRPDIPHRARESATVERG